MKILRSCLPFLLLASIASPVYSQGSSSAGLSGRVVDTSGAPLIGATILVEDQNSTSFFGATTDLEGNYRIPNVPRGTYKVTVSFTGFKTDERTVFHGNLETVRKFVLQESFGTLDAVVVSAANAASNRPGFVRGSSLAPGAMMVGFTQNGGPEQLAVTQTTQLERELAGFSGFVETGGERFDIYPVFTVANQFAAVLDADTPPGFGNLFFSFNGVQSNPFRIHVAESQPGIFTRSQDGKGAAIVTRPDFQLVGPNNPLRFGDTAIVWGADGSSFDNSPGVEDLRGVLDIDLFLGGVRIPDDAFRYYGPSGGFAGGLQVIFDVFEGAPTGCNVPFFIRVGFDGQSALSNITGIPISGGEGHCGDRHGHSSAVMERLFSNNPLRRLVATVTENGTRDGESFFRGGFSTLRGFEFTRVAHERPPAAGGLTLTWNPETFTGVAPRRLNLTGSYALDLPWIRIQHGPSSYFNFFDAPDANAITDGPFSVSAGEDFAVDNTLFPHGVNGNYVRRAGVLMDRVDEAVTSAYLQQRVLSFGQVVDAVRESGMADEDTIVQYELFVDDGRLGNYTLEGYLLGGLSSSGFPRSFYDNQQQMISKHLFPPTAENISLLIRYLSSDTNLTQQHSGPVDETEQVFDAEAVYRITPGEYEEAFKVEY